VNGAFDFFMSEQDYRSFNLRLFLRRCGIPTLIPFVLIVAAIAIADPEADIFAFASPFAGASAALCFLLYLTLRNSQRIYRETPSMQQKRSVVYDESGFEFSQESGVLRGPWTDINRWSIDKHALVLWLNQAMMILIPRSSGSSAHIDSITVNLQNSGLARGKKRNRKLLS